MLLRHEKAEETRAAYPHLTDALSLLHMRAGDSLVRWMAEQAYSKPVRKRYRLQHATFRSRNNGLVYYHVGIRNKFRGETLIVRPIPKRGWVK